MKKLFEKYVYKERLLFAGGSYVNIENLTEQQLDDFNQKNPGLLKLAEPPAAKVDESTSGGELPAPPDLTKEETKKAAKAAKN